ncbi:MAG: ABC transporter ATP-binding protein [Bacteroidetes bacterium]|nr:MAG: ABC transporter ATP-binding protein [Bacteroidota bacterium]
MNQQILKVEKLEKYYGNFHALKGVDMQVHRGEIFGLLGPNGAGKTTMLRMLVGLIAPSAGRVTYFGELQLNELNKVLPRIGCIIEEPKFYPYLSGLTNLKVAAKYFPNKIPDDRIHEMIGLVGLKGRENDRVSTYSQGMRQRLGIAQAMLNNPDLIFLDEPTNGLDPKGIIELRQLIIRLKEEFGKTVIISSHILSEIEEMADSMAIINNGKCVSQGPVAELLAKNTVTVSVETDDQEAALVTLMALEFRPTRDQNTLVFQAELNQIPTVVEKLILTGRKIYRLDHRRKLEDYFLKLTAA